MSRRTALGRFASVGLGSVFAGVATAGAGIAIASGSVKAASIFDVVPQWFDAWMSFDPPSSLAPFYSTGGVYEDVAWGAYVLAPDIEGYLRTTLAGLSNFQRYALGSFAVDNFAAVEQTITGANQGLFPGAPFGATFECYAVTLFEFDGNLLTRTVDYYDIAGLLMQMGVWPSWPGNQEPEQDQPEDDCGILCKKSG